MSDSRRREYESPRPLFLLFVLFISCFSVSFSVGLLHRHLNVGFSSFRGISCAVFNRSPNGAPTPIDSASRNPLSEDDQITKKYNKIKMVNN